MILSVYKSPKNPGQYEFDSLKSDKFEFYIYVYEQ